MHSSRRTEWSTTMLPLFVVQPTVSQLTLLSTLCGFLYLKSMQENLLQFTFLHLLEVKSTRM